MRKLAFLCVAFALVAVSFYGCDETNPTEPATNATAIETPLFDVNPVKTDDTCTDGQTIVWSAAESIWVCADVPAGLLYGYEWVFEGRNRTLAPGAVTGIQVRCPAGKIALGGGVYARSDGWVVADSRGGNYVSGRPTAWWGGLKNVSGEAETNYIEVEVFCANET